MVADVGYVGLVFDTISFQTIVSFCVETLLLREVWSKM